MSTCEKCGNEKMVSCVRETDHPDMHEKGSWHEYCDTCDTPPEITLDAEKEVELVRDPPTV